MATHSSILAWRIPWTEEPDQATVHGITKSQSQLNDWAHTHTLTHTRLSSLELMNKACPAVVSGQGHKRGLWQIPSVSGYMTFHLGWSFSLRKNLVYFQYKTSHSLHCRWYPQAHSLLGSMTPRSKLQHIDPETFQTSCAPSYDHYFYTIFCDATWSTTSS